MRTLQISSEALGRPSFAPAFVSLHQLQGQLERPLCLIGALARDVWFQSNLQKAPSRLTLDLDMGSFLLKRQDWEAIRTYLIQQEGFTTKATHPIALFSPTGIKVDLLPYGPIAEKNAVDIGSTDGPLWVMGMEEVCSAAVPVQIDNSQFRLATVPGLCLLKLIAYQHQPEFRMHDLTDIAEMAENFFELQDDLIYDKHANLLDLYDPDEALGFTHRVGSHALGQEIRAQAQANDSLIQALRQILNKLAGECTHLIWEPLRVGFEEA